MENIEKIALITSLSLIESLYEDNELPKDVCIKRLKELYSTIENESKKAYKAYELMEELRRSTYDKLNDLID